MGHIENRLAELGMTLPPPMPPAGLYVPCRRVGDVMHVGGHGPVAGSTIVTGKVGSTLTLAEAQDAARMTCLSMLASIQAELGTLDGIVHWVSVFGMVNCAPGFNQTPQVIDGFSATVLEIFGQEAGSHARSAVGMAELPFDIPVEVEAVVALA